MVKLDRFEIVFDNPENAYFAGQEVSGKVIIESPEDKKVNEILLEIKGRAKTYWCKGSGKNRKHCGQSEPYFCEQFNTKYTHKFSITAGKNKHEKERILPKGTHEVPFQYTLSKSLPTSFEGSYGYVRYTCRAICERPWDFDICTKKIFTVIGIEDMNDDSKLTTPMTCNDTCISNTSSLTKIFCINKSPQYVLLEMAADRLGFTPGETLYLKGKVENKGNSSLKHINLSMIQDVVYKAKNFSGAEFEKKESKVIFKKNIGEIKGHSTLDLSKTSASEITFLSLPPTLSSCSLIIITYKIVLSISSQSSIYIPITIGTIPLLSELVTKTMKNGRKTRQINNSSKNYHKKSDVKVTVTDECGITIKTTPTPSRSTEHSEVEDNDNLQMNEDGASKNLLMANGHDGGTSTTIKKRVRMASSILSEIYPQLPPPFYKESFFGAVNVIDEKEEGYFGDKLFTPKYPVYFDDE
uniref:Arrestin_C domain-containing protein n=1 Tax=Parastrongyloides trichosuri TaxID=131310 RepID=A0A0N4Z9Z1_PARTI